MQKLISHRAELAVMLGDKTAKLVYMLADNAMCKDKMHYEVAVVMNCDGVEESETISCVDTSESEVFGFFRRLVEGMVMPMSLGEVTQDFLASQQ